jgi:hypothetical protein
MDPLIQRLQVAQNFAQALITLLELPIKPTRAQVQATIDTANAQLKNIIAQETTPTAPLVPPQLVPATATTTATAGKTT